MGKITDSNLEGGTLPDTGAEMTELEFDAWFTREVLPLEAALMQFLRRSYRDEGELEDVCQEAFIKVYEAARRERPTSVKPFVFTVARNIVVDRARHARIIPIEAALDLDALEIANDEPGPERTVIARDELKRLQAALDRLPKRCREAVILRKVEGLSMREIARRMGISIKTVDAHLVQGAAALANILYAETADPGRAP
jgi:RNA polymerase sigma-70 factor (ECF subfamily)